MIIPQSARDAAGVDLDHCAAVGRLDAGWACSGVLVHPRIVLTTAHGRYWSPLPRAVALNTADLTQPGAEIIPGRFISHPSYTGRGAYDIAAMILDRPAEAKPVDLASTREIAEATHVTLAGFGACVEIRGSGLKIRRSTRVPIRSGDALSRRFDPDLELIVGADDRGACFGDSGGPAYIGSNGQRKLAAIISRPLAAQKPYCKGPAILTRVDSFASWIQSLI